jgi:hypothetical protein
MYRRNVSFVDLRHRLWTGLSILFISAVVLACSQASGPTNPTNPTDPTDPGGNPGSENPVAALSSAIWGLDSSGAVYEITTGTDLPISGFEHSVRKLYFHDGNVYYVAVDNSPVSISLYQWVKEGPDRLVNTCIGSNGIITVDGYYYVSTQYIPGNPGTTITIIKQIPLSSGMTLTIPGMDVHDQETYGELYSTSEGLCYEVRGTTDGTQWWEIRRVTGSETTGTGDNDVEVLPRSLSNTFQIAKISHYQGKWYIYAWGRMDEDGLEGLYSIEADGSWNLIADTRAFDTKIVDDTCVFIGTATQVGVGISFPIIPTVPSVPVWYSNDGIVYEYSNDTDTTILGFDYPAHRIFHYGKSVYYLSENATKTGYRLLQWKRDEVDRIVYNLSSDYLSEECFPFTITGNAIYYVSYVDAGSTFQVRKFSLMDRTDTEVAGYDGVAGITGLYALDDGLYYSTADGIFKKNGIEASGTGTDDSLLVQYGLCPNTQNNLRYDFKLTTYRDDYWYSFGPGNWGFFKSDAQGRTVYSNQYEDRDTYWDQDGVTFIGELDQLEVGIDITGLAGGVSGEIPPFNVEDVLLVNAAMTAGQQAAFLSTDSNNTAYNTMDVATSTYTLTFNGFTHTNGVTLTGSLSAVLTTGENYSCLYTGDAYVWKRSFLPIG